jgi:hypothetical protein
MGFSGTTGEIARPCYVRHKLGAAIGHDVGDARDDGKEPQGRARRPTSSNHALLDFMYSGQAIHRHVDLK